MADGDKQHQLSQAPPSAPLLRAREIGRRIELEQQLEPGNEPERPVEVGRPPSAGTGRPAKDHPWRRYPAVRPSPR